MAHPRVGEGQRLEVGVDEAGREVEEEEDEGDAGPGVVEAGLVSAVGVQLRRGSDVLLLLLCYYPMASTILLRLVLWWCSRDGGRNGEGGEKMGGGARKEEGDG